MMACTQYIAIGVCTVFGICLRLREHGPVVPHIPSYELCSLMSTAIAEPHTVNSK